MRKEESIATIDQIFNARSMAVVGASSNPVKWGYKTLKSIIDGGYQGKLFAVNPHEKEILGVPTYQSVAEIAEDIDLMVILISAQQVIETLRQGIEKKAKGAVVISSGFREAGRKDLEDELYEVIKNSNLRIVGPNIQGINYVPNKMCAVVLPLITKRGPISIVSQSGSVSATISEWAERDEVGITGMVNLGNQVDLCESDFLEYFAEDKNTKAIMLYLEGPKQGDRFKEVLKKVAPQKPVIILKPGRNTAGRKAAATHTASMAGDDDVFTCACKQFGAIRALSMEEFYDIGKALAMQRLPQGKKVLVVTTSGGVGALTMDKVGEYGFDAVSLSPGLINDLKSNVTGAGANYANPIDIPFLEAEYWQQTLETLVKHNIADTVIFSIADAVPGIERVIIDYSSKAKVPVVVTYMGGGEAEVTGSLRLQENGIPVYSTPERAVRALAELCWYAEFRRCN